MIRPIRFFCLVFLFMFTILFSVPVLAQLTIQQNSTSRKIVYIQYATGTSTPTAGLTPTVTLSKNGGAFAAAAGTAAGISNGAYAFSPAAADTNTLGSLLIQITAAGADPVFKEVNIIFNNPDAGPADTAGTTTLLSRIPGIVQPQTGDSYARLGAPVGASHSADVAAIPAAVWGVGVRTLTAFAFQPTIGGYATGQDPATLVLSATASSFNAAGTIGNKINGAASAGDPWSTALPGGYAAGSAGYILGTNLNATITSRMATFGLPTNFSSLLISSGGLIRHDLSQPLDTSLTGDTVGGALVGARAQAFGKWVISGSTLTMYAADGTTVLRTFTISPTPTAASRQ